MYINPPANVLVIIKTKKDGTIVKECYNNFDSIKNDYLAGALFATVVGFALIFYLNEFPKNLWGLFLSPLGLLLLLIFPIGIPYCYIFQKPYFSEILNKE